MAEKKYYWLKLQKDFFSSLRIKKLRKLAGGDTFTIIYLKMQLLSLNNDGRLEYKGIENTFEEEMALELDEDLENVKITIQYLLSCGLLETEEPDEYVLPYVIANTGGESESAGRVRKHRESQKTLQCNADVTKCNAIETKCNTEKEIEKEIEIESEKRKEKDTDKDKNYIVEIIDYLNMVCGSQYHSDSNKTRTLIKARLNEGFTMDDFKTVIDKKAKEWINDPKYCKYLRPETLFGNKFEGYLNQRAAGTRTEQAFNMVDDWVNQTKGDIL